MQTSSTSHAPEDSSSNQAAWLVAKSVRPLEVKTAPFPTNLGENQVIVKNAAVAINPVDWIIQKIGHIAFPWIKYPLILGSDLAGQVVQVGSAVTRFNPGDRVLAHAVGLDPSSNSSAEAAFQLYTVVRENMASPIPTSLTYENACVLPLGLSTAACALYQKDFLALTYPSVSTTMRDSHGKTLLVWGGSTSVGSNAIQLAVASGYEVIATASPKNFAYVKKLGAVEAFDYKSTTVVPDIIAAFRDREAAGAVGIGANSLAPCVEILRGSRGNKFVAQASFNMPKEFPTSILGWLAMGVSVATSSLTMAARCRWYGVRVKYIFGSSLMANEVSRAIYQDFLPSALAEGTYVTAPEPIVVGRGLDLVQEALDLNERGVSAQKVVVSL